ncbi:MAG: hypothetical protein ABSF73_08765 [Terriglobia bacterium]|jgi:hypothetical protein
MSKAISPGSEVTLESGATFYRGHGLSFLHADNVQHTSVKAMSNRGKLGVEVDIAHMIGDFPSSDLCIYLSLGNALAIGAVAVAEMAGLARETGGASGLEESDVEALEDSASRLARVLEPLAAERSDPLLDILDKVEEAAGTVVLDRFTAARKIAEASHTAALTGEHDGYRHAGEDMTAERREHFSPGPRNGHELLGECGLMGPDVDDEPERDTALEALLAEEEIIDRRRLDGPAEFLEHMDLDDRIFRAERYGENLDMATEPRFTVANLVAGVEGSRASWIVFDSRTLDNAANTPSILEAAGYRPAVAFDSHAEAQRAADELNLAVAEGEAEPHKAAPRFVVVGPKRMSDYGGLRWLIVDTATGFNAGMDERAPWHDIVRYTYGDELEAKSVAGKLNEIARGEGVADERVTDRFRAFDEH